MAGAGWFRCPERGGSDGGLWITMKQLAFMVCVGIALALAVPAQAGPYFDDFEGYAVGSNVHGQGGWEGWDGDANAGALVSDVQAFSGAKSVNVTGGSDLVKPFTGVAGGQWTFSVKQFVPSTSTGTPYVILMNSYPANKNWSVQIEQNTATGQAAEVDGKGSGTLPFVKDQWADWRFFIDLTQNNVEGWYNGKLLTTHTWQTDGINEFQAVDLFANGSGPVFYDDVRLDSGFVIPEPGTIGLALLGALAAAASLRKRA